MRKYLEFRDLHIGHDKAVRKAVKDDVKWVDYITYLDMKISSGHLGLCESASTTILRE